MLDNPVWRALTGEQREFACEQATFVRYPPDVLPFAAVGGKDMLVDAKRALEHGTVFFCDVLPAFGDQRVAESRFRVAQMMYRGPAQTELAQEGEAELSLAHADEMIELTDVAFPGFFRRHTVRLGRYLGIRIEGRLVAMAGERFRQNGLREISAVCTRPGFTGRGYAGHLMKRLLNGEADTSYLHVGESNTHAIALYERLGFRHERTIDVMKVDRLMG